MSIHLTDERNDPQHHWARLCALTAPEDRNILKAAYGLAARAHAGQWRHVHEGAPCVAYVVHPLRVACIVAGEWGRTERAILLAALLHDVLEDVEEAYRQEYVEEIRDLAGKEIEEAVWTLTKPAAAPYEIKAARDARYFSELRSAPEWVRLVKCADRVDNLRDASAWGNLAFWERYSSETIGWHLVMARETAAIAEVALFGALVAGERDIRGRVPIWADGYLVDPVAAALISESLSERTQAVGVALQGETLFVGISDPDDLSALEALQQATGKSILPLRISAEGIRDVQQAHLARRC